MTDTSVDVTPMNWRVDSTAAGVNDAMHAQVAELLGREQPQRNLFTPFGHDLRALDNPYFSPSLSMQRCNLGTELKPNRQVRTRQRIEKIADCHRGCRSADAGRCNLRARGDRCRTQQGGCDKSPEAKRHDPRVASKPGPGKSREALTAQESAKLDTWFEARYEETLARSPMTQTFYGVKSGQARLDDVSKLAANETAALQKSWLTELGTQFDKDRLEGQSLLSYRLFEYSTQDALASHKMADHEYVFQPMSGPHTGLPSFMLNFHSIDSAQDAESYIERLKAFDAYKTITKFA